MRRNPAVATLLCAAVLFSGCHPASSDELRGEVRADLDARKFSEALAVCADALAREDVRANADTRWYFKRSQFSAQVATGKCAEVRDALDDPAQPDAARIDAALYARCARDAGAVGDMPGAVVLIEAGIKRFPERKADFQDVYDDLLQAAKPDDPGMQSLEEISYLSRAKKKSVPAK